MARAACGVLGPRITAGIVITKYHHSRGPCLPWRSGRQAIPLWTMPRSALPEGPWSWSAVSPRRIRSSFFSPAAAPPLFERSELPLVELQEISRQLLSCGADIQEINCIRKRLSAVKGGRFGAACAPARVVSVILSDVVGDRLDMIASGPACGYLH